MNVLSLEQLFKLFGRSSRSGPKKRLRNSIRIEGLEDRTVPAPIPSTAIVAPATVLIGETANIQISFDNESSTASDVGYGPYIDLYLPATGKDGDDGISFQSATYQGQPLAGTVITLTAAGVPHPYAVTASGSPLIIKPPSGFREGDQLVVFELPFGSFAPAQPAIDVDVTVMLSPLADLNKPLPVRSQGGFQFGADPLDNPTSDPTIVGTGSNDQITPILFSLRKEYIGPEDETTTGPNFVRQYRVVADIADGQTVSNLTLTDKLPKNLQFVSVDSVTGMGTALVTDVRTPSTTVPGGRLARRLDSVTGSTSTSDAVMLFSFYAPETTAPPGAKPVLHLMTGQPSTAIDDVSAIGKWNPLDPRDSTRVVRSDETKVDHTLTLRSLATQKTASLVNDTGAPGYTPGDTIEYTLDVQVSDYFAFDNIVLTDLLGDGFAVDASFTPTLEVNEHGVATTTTFVAPNFTVTPGTPEDTVTFRISDQLVADGQDGILAGGNIPDGGTGTGNLPQSSPALYSPGTTMRVRFRAVIQDTYEQTQPAGNNTVTSDDVLGNDVSVSGRLLNYEDLSPKNVPPVTDTSDEDITIVPSDSDKSVYAVNGSMGIADPAVVAQGDEVTYRLTVNLPTMSFTKFKLSDYLPLPVFDVSEITAFNPSVPSATAPPAGQITLGPSDTFWSSYTSLGGTGPTLAIDTASNGFTLDFGDLNDPNNQPTTLDLLFTVTVTSEPKADELTLTNQLVTQQNNNENVTTTDQDEAQVVTSEPNIPKQNVRKGVVATDNPNAIFSPAAVGPVNFNAPGTAGARFAGTINSTGLDQQPIDSNLSGIDAGDLVTFAITIENEGTGPSGAFDIRIRDTLPVGFVIPAGGLNLTVTDGTGAIISFVNLGSGASSGLFGTGIELVDPGPTPVPGGALDPGKNVDGNVIDTGRNIAIITYDLAVAGKITPNTTITNTASLTNYADAEGGPSFIAAPISDDASVVSTTPTIVKRLVGTEIDNANNSNSQAVIGELVTYEVVLTLPEGQMKEIVFNDTLDEGLAFVRLESVVRSNGIVHRSARVAVSNSGRTAQVNLGRVVNLNRDNNVPDTVTVRYTAVVLDTAGNQAGTQLRNNVRLTYSGGPPISAMADAITVIEPTIDVQKDARVNGGTNVGQAGDTVEYSIVVTNPGNVDAFDVTLEDALPQASNGQSLISNPVIASVVDSNGIVVATDFQIIGSEARGYTLRSRLGKSFDFPVDAGRTITIRVTGTLPIIVQPDQLITNCATVRWTSLDGNPGKRSRFNTASTERTGSEVGPNDYVDTDCADVQIGGRPAKILVSTSDSFTSGNDVAIGEIARYRIAYQFPQGSATAFDFVDRLPAGMQFLNDGTTTIAFVSNGPGFMVDNAIFPAGSDAFVTGNFSTPVVPTFVLPASQITGGAGSGDDVTFSLGDVVNGDLDDDAELIYLEFNALVLNEAANQAGTVLPNDFVTRESGVPIGDPSKPVNVNVVEPTLTIDKTVNPTSGDAGDRFDFTVVVTQPSGANQSPAHDVRILDVMPPEYTLDPSSVTVTLVGTNSASTNNSAGNTLDVIVDTLPPGASVVVKYTALLNAAVLPLQVVTNTASLTYTSLPGPTGQSPNPTGSVTPGNSGSPNGERDGEGGINDYLDSDSASIQAPSLLMDKRVASTSFTETGLAQHNPLIHDLAIGEQVTFVVGFVVLEGTTPAFLVDDLPIAPGKLEAISGEVISIGANISGSNLNAGDSGVISDRSGDGINDRASFNFGTLVNSPDNRVTIDDMIFVRITALVPDVPENVDGVLLVNTATLDFVAGQLSDTAEVEIVEPELDITKNVTSTTTVTAGSVVDYELRITHTGNSTMDATNVVIDDPLPPGAGLTYVPGSASVTPSGGATIVEPSSSGTGFEVQIANLPLGSEVVVRYQAIVTDQAVPGDTFDNTADLGYNGTPTDPTIRVNTDDATAQVVVEGASISGYVLHEQRTTADLPIPGTTVTLTGTDSGGRLVLRTTTTDGNGFYEFLNLVPGTYTIVETQPAGFLTSRQETGTPYALPSPVVDQLNFEVPVGALTAAMNYNFWEVQPSSLAGYVYEDLMNNMVRDPVLDRGIPNTLVRLTGTDWNGQAVSATLRTNPDGSYLFDNLLPGDYRIIETQPGGYLDNADNIGSLGGTNPVNDRFDVTIDQNQTGTEYDFGELTPVSLSGFVYVDRNNNGQMNRSDPGIKNVRVTLTGIDDLGNSVSIEMLTVTGGAFNFLNLRPGIYTLTERQPSAFLDGKDRAGNLGGITPPNDVISDIVIGPNEAGTDYLFGERLRPNVSIAEYSKRGFLY